MASLRKLKRIIVCQGSIQLITALSVLSYREERQQPEYEYEDYLVICGLCAPSGQINQFAAFVEKMARLSRSWKRMVHIGAEQVEAIAAQLSCSKPRKVFSSIYDLVGTTTGDEIYLCRNWQLSNQLLINAYQSAEKICYGDGIGLYFSEAYFLPTPKQESKPLNEGERRSHRGLLSRLKSFPDKLKPVRKPTTSLKEVDFDIGYFLLPDALGEQPPMRSVRVDKAIALNLFLKYKDLLDASYVESVRSRVAGRPVVILLTSNFYEAGRMTLENELSAYREFLERSSPPPAPDSVLLIKPHPRENDFKIERLRLSLGNLFSDVLLLTQPNLFFVPFEIFLIQTFLDGDLVVPEKLQVITFSTACLSLELLFKAKPVVGFGSEIVNRFFQEEYVEGRIRHESDLLCAVKGMTTSLA